MLKNILLALEHRVASIEKYLTELPDKIRIETRKDIERKNIY